MFLLVLFVCNKQSLWLLPSGTPAVMDTTHADDDEVRRDAEQDCTFHASGGEFAQHVLSGLRKAVRNKKSGSVPAAWSSRHQQQKHRLEQQLLQYSDPSKHGATPESDSSSTFTRLPGESADDAQARTKAFRVAWRAVRGAASGLGRTDNAAFARVAEFAREMGVSHTQASVLPVVLLFAGAGVMC